MKGTRQRAFCVHDSGMALSAALSADVLVFFEATP